MTRSQKPPSVYESFENSLHTTKQSYGLIEPTKGISKTLLYVLRSKHLKGLSILPYDKMTSNFLLDHVSCYVRVLIPNFQVKGNIM